MLKDQVGDGSPLPGAGCSRAGASIPGGSVDLGQFRRPGGGGQPGGGGLLFPPLSPGTSPDTRGPLQLGHRGLGVEPPQRRPRQRPLQPPGQVLLHGLGPRPARRVLGQVDHPAPGQVLPNVLQPTPAPTDRRHHPHGLFRVPDVHVPAGRVVEQPPVGRQQGRVDRFPQGPAVTVTGQAGAQQVQESPRLQQVGRRGAGRRRVESASTSAERSGDVADGPDQDQTVPGPGHGHVQDTHFLGQALRRQPVLQGLAGHRLGPDAPGGIHQSRPETQVPVQQDRVREVVPVELPPQVGHQHHGNSRPLLW